MTLREPDDPSGNRMALREEVQTVDATIVGS
jgi:hypothetical protein